MNKKDFFAAVAEGNITDEIKDCAWQELRKMEDAAQRTKEAKERKEQIIREHIIDCLSTGETMNVGAMYESFIENYTDDYTAGAIQYICNKMAKAGEIEKTKILIDGKARVAYKAIEAGN